MVRLINPNRSREAVGDMTKQQIQQLGRYRIHHGYRNIFGPVFLYPDKQAGKLTSSQEFFGDDGLTDYERGVLEKI